MSFIRFCINRPVTVIVGAIVVVLAGLLSFSAVPIQLTPNIDKTNITVRTFWEGASPIEIEREIIDEQEERLRGVSNLVKMRSVSQQDEGVITLEFAIGTDKNVALREVSDRLREVPEYPENVDEPVVRTGDDRDRDYIAWIIANSPDPNFDMRRAFDFFDDRVKPYLERSPGVSEVNVLGGTEREARLLVDAEKLAQRGVTFPELIESLRGENVNVSAGQLPEGKRDVRVRVVGEYESPGQILDTIVAYRAGGPVFFRDVGTVEISYKEATSEVRQNGNVSLAINVQREPGSNVLVVMDELQRRLDELNSPGGMLAQESTKLGLSAPMHLKQVYDQTIYIYQALELVRSNIFLGGALAIIVLLLFLRSLRATLIVAITIPVSIIGSFIVLQVLGRNINIISLAGMAFATGMVVDNAIVVLENIYRRRQEGDDAPTAALRGTNEVWAAVLVSTLTTVIVFAPVLTIQEEVGQLFRDIALSICAAVLLSLLASITIIPMFGARLLRRGVVGVGEKSKTKRRPISSAFRRLDGFFAGLRDAYVKALSVVMRSWIARIGIVGALTLGALAGSLVLLPPASYLPAGNRNLIFAFLIPPPGYNLAMQSELGRRVESTIAPYWEAAGDEAASAALPEVTGPDPITGQIRTVQPPPIDNFFFVAIQGSMFMGAIATEEARVRNLIPLFQHAAGPQAAPGVFAFPIQLPLFQVGSFGSGNSVELEIVGEDLNEVRSAAYALMGVGFGFVGQGVFESIRPDPGNFNISGQEVRVDVDRVRAAEVGFSVRDVATAVRAAGDGAIVGEYQEGGTRIDLRVIESRQNDWASPAIDFAEIASVPVATPSGRTVTIGDLASLSRVDSPQQINRSEGQRSVTLNISAPAGRALEDVMDVIQTQMIEPLRAQGVVPPTVETSLSGAASKLTEVRSAMLGEWGGGLLDALVSVLSSRMFLAILFSYLLMCALFESFLYPLVIMVTVPLALIGGVLGLRIVHEFDTTQQLDTLTMLGFVILVGIVVNNAVLIVAQSLNFMRGFGESESDPIEPMHPHAAVAESVRTRARPILMTTMTSVIGMAPLVLMPGAGSELYRGLGSVVLTGLLFATVFTLGVVPMLLTLVLDAKQAVFGAADGPAKAARERWEARSRDRRGASSAAKASLHSNGAPDHGASRPTERPATTNA
jgi:HAE1 family hydrophobic/amphiphilic exporter-1